MSADLIDLVQRLGQPRVLVVGDLMLDRYVWGDAERISQEAPVILLRADRREERLGGASSVATLLRALGARPALAGVVGADADGARLRRTLLDQGIGVALWGARRPDQLRATAGVAGWSLDRVTLAAIDRILNETITDPIGPEFMAPLDRS